ncbi:nitroreductase family deazaflavin-dependent oxidoreductase [Frankia sp. Ag45/Mut15]|uniref:Nitroreductase family deazaflavin-dependent oxidoreductase n=1 Tax=Frankia umida TaxID=573489 RepID=A0ABT0JWX1_9ACTN|nr:nitroreductase/quinone reductase family protein [Frankia umida]MCK9876045.1 nitroreductase family deazaflavin-dependent oxidoreductase [Frankia umida]
MADTQVPRTPGFDLKAVNQTVIAEYRATGGVLEKTLPGSRLVLLTTIGRHSGKEHVTPLGYVAEAPTPDAGPAADGSTTTDSSSMGEGDQPAAAGGSGVDARRSDRLVVFASNMASSRHPDWYLNLTANPKVVVELGHERVDAEATTATADERVRLYAALVETMPGIRGHQDQVDREIPVVVLALLR